MGIGNKLNVPIKGEGVPFIPNPENKKGWYGTSLAWMTHGYGVEITPLQTLAFYNAIANDGEMVKPRFIKEVRSQDKMIKRFKREVLNPKICSQETIDKVKVMMENVVRRGTAENIYDENYSMAGKTGTCQTEYWTGNTQYVSSFVGYFPAKSPKYSCIVVIHKPNKKKGYYGNVVAAPVFKKIAQKIYTDTPLLEEIDKSKFDYQLVHNDFEDYNSIARKGYTTMPNLKNMPGMDAIALLENLGLRVNSEGTGKVTKQSIKAGKKIEKGSIIKLNLL
jgi:cell division protein FtsI (penicillin-binding protein 3)